MAKIHIQIF